MWPAETRELTTPVVEGEKNSPYIFVRSIYSLKHQFCNQIQSLLFIEVNKSVLFYLTHQKVCLWEFSGWALTSKQYKLRILTGGGSDLLQIAHDN